MSRCPSPVYPPSRQGRRDIWAETLLGQKQHLNSNVTWPVFEARSPCPVLSSPVDKTEWTSRLKSCMWANYIISAPMSHGYYKASHRRCPRSHILSCPPPMQVKMACLRKPCFLRLDTKTFVDCPGKFCLQPGVTLLHLWKQLSVKFNQFAIGLDEPTNSVSSYL